MNRTIARAAASIVFALAAAAQAQDLSIFAGALRPTSPPQTTYGWSISYAHDLTDHLFASATYLNEGHVPRHHRDGHAAQLWVRTRDFSPGLTLAAGVGPYHYFDTTIAESQPAAFADAHGWGAIYSLSAAYRTSSPWYYELRVNRVQTPRNIDTTSILVGAGYRLEQDGSFIRNSDMTWKHRDDELVAFTGKTIVNSFESQTAPARSFEYRRQLTPIFRASASWINEGDARLIRRNGFVSQLWFEPGFYEDRFTLGAGFGAYFALDEYHSPRRHVEGILGTTFSYHISRGILARLTWQRIASTYDRDSDILLLGVGYRF